MKAEIITIGDEILIGQIVDSNSAFIAKELNDVGVSVVQITTTSDDAESIINSIKQAEQRAEIIILTGGLGPTKDDITKLTLAKYFNTKLVFNQDVYNHVEKLLSGRGITMNDLNGKQAYVPENCEIMFNNVGTAPGMLFNQNAKVYISMPGVPFEMKHIITDRLIPFIKQNYITEEIVHKTVMTQGIPESHLAEKIEDWENNLPQEIKLAYLPQPGIVRLRLTARGKDRGRLNSLIENRVEELQKIIPEAVYGFNEEKIELAVYKLLKKQNKTMATAESCTGGNISALITSIPGSSAVFKGSVIAYSNEIKHKFLNVSENILEMHGAVSQQTVEEMCKGLLNTFETDYAISVSGIAGPDGGTKEKPVGTIWICVASKHRLIAEKHLFGEDRGRNIRRATLTALNMLRNNFLR